MQILKAESKNERERKKPQRDPTSPSTHILPIFYSLFIISLYSSNLHILLNLLTPDRYVHRGELCACFLLMGDGGMSGNLARNEDH